MPKEDNNAIENFGSQEDEKSILEEQKIEKDHKNLIGKSLNTESHAKNGLLRRTFQNKLLASELSLFFGEVKFNKQQFSVSKHVSDIKYHYSGFQNNNSFYLFNNQLNYALANCFAESKITKNNVDRFSSNLLIVLLTEKLSY